VPSFRHSVQRLIVATVVAMTSVLAMSGAGAVDPVGDTTVEWVTIERTADGSLQTATITLPADQAHEIAAAVDAGSLLVQSDPVDGVSSGPVVQALGAAPVVLAIEPPIEFQAFADPYREFQWGLDRTTFAAARNATPNEGAAVVAVLDTGIRGSHEDLAGVLVGGADFVSGSGDGLVADHFHGSHVAGIIAAATNNSVGIEGAGAGLRIMPVRVLNSTGSGSSSNVANGIVWATDNGADVINLSLGSTQNSAVVAVAIDYAVSNNVVVVAASGNSGAQGNPTMYPAALDSVISVGAITETDTRASFSGYGSWLDVVAPGEGILSLHNSDDDGYAYANGTSMASPFVAAAAGLLKAIDPTLTAAEVLQLLTSGAEDLGPVGQDNEFGAGLVDPNRAIQLAAEGITNPDSGTPNPQTAGPGYSFVTSLGRVLTQGSAQSHGSLESVALAQPIVAAIPTPSGNGYWMAGGDGGIFSFGDADWFGSTGTIALAKPVVGMSSTASGKGYWMVASDGGIFNFGNAAFHGSAGNLALAKPIVGMAPTATGNGYWLVASDGGIFAYGGAKFHGSAGAIALQKPIVGMAPTPSGKGYWLVASDGGIFAYGDAGFFGSTGAIALDQPIVGMTPTASGKGYWLFAADGGVFSFGDAQYGGSAAGQLLAGESAIAMLLAN
jgi:subtilisin family serine protease